MQDILFFLKKYQKELIGGFLIILCIVLSCYSIFISTKKEEEVDSMLLADLTSMDEEEKEKTVEESTTIYVDIKGVTEKENDMEVVADIIVEKETLCVLYDLIQAGLVRKEEEYENNK